MNRLHERFYIPSVFRTGKKIHREKELPKSSGSASAMASLGFFDAPIMTKNPEQ